MRKDITRTTLGLRPLAIYYAGVFLLAIFTHLLLKM